MWSTDSPESGKDLIELTSVYRDGQDMQRKSPKVGNQRLLSTSFQQD